MHVTTGPPTTYEGLPGPGNKTFLVMFPAPTFTLVGKHPSSPSQHGSVPPMRDSFSSPQPEDTGALSPLRADRGGVATNQSPRDVYFSPRRLRVLVGVMARCEASRYTLSRLGGSKPMLGPTFGAGADRFDSRGHSVILSGSMAVLQGNINTKKTSV